MKVKPFSPELYRDNDAEAKAKVLRYVNMKLAEYGLEELALVQNPNRFGCDLILPQLRFFIEPGVKHNWEGAWFPFADVQVEQRKWKYAEPGPWGDWGCLWYLNDQFTHAIIFDHSELKGAGIRYVAAKYGEYAGSKEPFKFIGIEKCNIIRLV